LIPAVRNAESVAVACVRATISSQAGLVRFRICLMMPAITFASLVGD
jgi:hypothetical protein